MPTLTERVEGAIWGHLVADALGVPYEFHPPESVPTPVAMTPMPGFPRAHAGVRPGTWSDDGAQMLALLDSLLSRGRFDADDLGGRLLAWLDRGEYAVDGIVFDVGIQTAAALTRLRQGVPALRAGAADEQSNGNGSLMRVLPLGLWHRGTDADLCADAAASSRVTHAHPRSIACCQVYSLWVRRLRDGADAREGFTDAVATFREVLGPHAPEVREFDAHVLPVEGVPLGGSGYVVDTFRAAVQLTFAGGNYEQAVRAAISLGHDTDTTACVVGGVVGLIGGVQEVPQAWRDALRGEERARRLLARLEATIRE